MGVTDRRGAADSHGVIDFVDGVEHPSEVAPRIFARVQDQNAVLPPGQTVVDLSRRILTRALRWSGYRVVGPRDRGYREAAPIEVEVTTFWGRFIYGGGGYGANRYIFEIAMRLRGPIPGLRSAPTIRGEATRHSSSSRVVKIRNALYSSVEVFEDYLRGQLASVIPDVAPRILRTSIALPAFELTLVASPKQDRKSVGIILKRAKTEKGPSLQGCDSLSFQAGGQTLGVPHAKYGTGAGRGGRFEWVQVPIVKDLLPRLAGASDARVTACGLTAVLSDEARLRVYDFYMGLEDTLAHLGPPASTARGSDTVGDVQGSRPDPSPSATTPRGAPPPPAQPGIGTDAVPAPPTAVSAPVATPAPG